MLFLFLSWLFLSALGTAIGAALLSAFQISAFQHSGDRLIVAVWLGLLVESSALLALSVFLPLTPAVSFTALIVLAAGSLLVPGARHDLKGWLAGLNRPLILGTGFLSLSAAFNSTRIVEAYDTALYHYQFVRWLSQFGIVRGFALLQERFGTSSSWFALAAPFDFGPFQGRVAGLTGGLAILLCFVHFALALNRIVSHRALRSDWFLIGGYGLIIPICVAWTFEVSLSPDLPVWTLTMLAGWLILIVGDSESPGPAHSGNNLLLPLLLAAGAFTVKLSSAVTVLIAGIFYWFNSGRRWLDRIVLGVFAVIIAIPVFLANEVSSACPLYPNTFACLDLPWGVGKVAAKATAIDIRDWARWGGPAPSNATNLNWIVPWFLHADKLALLALCGFCLLGFAAARGWRGNRSSIYILALVFLGSGFVFLSAPNPRFGAGYLALCPALFLALIGPNVEKFLPRQWFARIRSRNVLPALLAIIAFLLLVQGSLRERILRHSMQSSFASVNIPLDHDLIPRLLVPPAIAGSSGDLVFTRNRRTDAPSILELTTGSYHGIDYERPVHGDQCWGAAIPCLPHPLEGDVYFREPSLGPRGGFSRLPPAP